MFLLYFFIVLAATTLGATTGMGGGVIIKPVLDALAPYDAATISLLSAITVFMMALVSVARQTVQGTPINPRFALPVGSTGKRTALGL